MNIHRTTLALALPLWLLQACGTNPPAADVTTQMARTEAVIQQADRSGVAVNSLPELQAAKDKYMQAKRELARKTSAGDDRALELAKQAEVDAQYASAKAQGASTTIAGAPVVITGGKQIAGAPKSTAAFGALFNTEAWSVSLSAITDRTTSPT